MMVCVFFQIMESIITYCSILQTENTLEEKRKDKDNFRLFLSWGLVWDRKRRSTATHGGNIQLIVQNDKHYTLSLPSIREISWILPLEYVHYVSRPKNVALFLY